MWRRARIGVGMSNAALLFLAVGLAMDATAVAAARGLASEHLHRTDVLRMALWFGAFQGGMPVIGWGIGEAIGPVVGTWGPWLVFLVLGGLGLKMIVEARAEDDQPTVVEPLSHRLLLLLAVATSVDALAVGVTLPILGAPLLRSALTIGGVTAILSVLGAIVGRRFGERLGGRLNAAGGWVLIALGVKAVLEPLGLF